MGRKRFLTLALALICLFSYMSFYSVSAEDTDSALISGAEPQASGLILMYDLTISKENSTTLFIEGLTDCRPEVVKCGFKNLKVQRRANSSSSWSDYHDYGNDYLDSWSYEIARPLTVDPGYQYRVTCKHYAKKNLLSTQTISNTSNIVTF